MQAKSSSGYEAWALQVTFVGHGMPSKNGLASISTASAAAQCHSQYCGGSSRRAAMRIPYASIDGMDTRLDCNLRLNQPATIVVTRHGMGQACRATIRQSGAIDAG